MATTVKALDIEELRREYGKRLPSLTKLAETLKRAIEGLLKAEGIKVQYIKPRIKLFDSFYEKIPRKGYTEPFEQTEDLCGLRIIAFLRSDLARINSMIEKEFFIDHGQDKSNELDQDRFGYRSHQYIISLKEQWLEGVEYRGLGGLKAELQVRSILMHA